MSRRIAGRMSAGLALMLSQRPDRWRRRGRHDGRRRERRRHGSRANRDGEAHG